jgi:hypothetical protein
MKRLLGVITAVLLLVSAPLVRGHEGHSHKRIMGTVRKVENNRIVVRSTEGKTVSIRLTRDTEYSSTDSEADRSDLRVGDRVVVIAMGENSDLTADEVRLSSEAARHRNRASDADEESEPQPQHSSGHYHSEYKDEPESSY